jgi:hypothetical protein
MAAYRQTGKMSLNAPISINLPDSDVLKRLVVADSGYIFDPILGKSYSTNSVGIVILKHIQNGENLDEILGVLTREFAVSREDAERGVIDFINSLQGQTK